MFENPRRGRQAKKVYNKCSANSKSQIVFRTDVFRKLSLGAPDLITTTVFFFNKRKTLNINVLYVKKLQFATVGTVGTEETEEQ